LRGGEIDIIAEDNGQIVFVEVKTRVSSSREFVMATINKEKQRKISKTALYFISKNRYTDYSGRFDVIFISGNTFCPDIEHIKDAFTLC
jgi:putative endonuclease